MFQTLLPSFVEKDHVTVFIPWLSYDSVNGIGNDWAPCCYVLCMNSMQYAWEID
jgi:hypothetical protein